MQVDLNSDLGESFGRYTIGNDDKVIPLITSANVACGFHASDPVVMKATVEKAKAAGVSCGAHPGYPDLMGFGRRNMVVTPEEAYSYTLYQIGALDAFLKAQGMTLQHVKPHGAFYNMAAKDRKQSEAICQAVKDYREALRRLKKHPDDKAAMKEAMELEDFFHSSWYGVLTQVDPDYLIDRLRKETVK